MKGIAWKKCKNNKGFSLVELIIVIAIMAVLIGVLAPTYMKYVERSKRTTDCANIGAILDACEVLAADPDVDWTAGEPGKITLVIDTNEPGHFSTYNPESSLVVETLNEMIDSNDVSIGSNWGPFTIYASCDTNNHLIFDISDNEQIAEIQQYSQALANRLE